MTHWERMGEHFGYPKCCVEHFVSLCCAGRMPGREQAAKDPHGPWIGTGYVPCDTHLEALRGKTRGDVSALIIGRVHPVAFPETDDAVIDGLLLATA